MQRIDIDKIKAHIERNKRRYICAGVVVGTVGIALITRSIMRRKNLSEVLRVSDAGVLRVPSQIDQSGSSFYFKRMDSSPVAIGNTNCNITTNIYKWDKGHPGYLTRCKETGEVFSSQKKAAKFAGTTPSCMSSHLSGLKPDVQGLHFERVVVQ